MDEDFFFGEEKKINSVIFYIVTSTKCNLCDSSLSLSPFVVYVYILKPNNTNTTTSGTEYIYFWIRFEIT